MTFSKSATFTILPEWRRSIVVEAVLTTILAGAFGSAVSCAAEPQNGISRVSATEDSIRISVDGLTGQMVHLVEFRPYESATPQTQPLPVRVGKLETNIIEVPRFDGRRDRLYAKWRLVAADKKTPLGSAQYVTDLSMLPRRRTKLLLDAGLKGLQCIVDVEDALSLGIKQAAHNVLISEVLDLSGGSKESAWPVDGERIPINMGYIRGLDQVVKPLTDAGVNVSLILLNRVPDKPDPHNPLIHPRTDLAGAPNHLGAFNLTDERGYRHYRAALEFLADRYSRSSKEHGLVSGFIIGNELQAHWWWYNLGEAEPESVMRDYTRALRVADLAIRRFHPRLRVYVSMDHHWTGRMSENSRRFIPGRTLLDQLNALVKSEGNFPWHVAFHPYPENLFEPRTWNDKAAVRKFGTPKITFRNLEVLPAYLGQSRFRFLEEPRRIILSEQGFHAAKGDDAERVQAAAYAYAYHRAKQIDQIDAFILHRHVDHAHEGGLRLGLRAHQLNTVTNPGRKRPIYDVFREADGPSWRSAIEFAKPIIGIDSWEQLRPVTIRGPEATGSQSQSPVP